MTGITLSSEEIRRAPSEVRRWIEQEVAAALGNRTEATDLQRQRAPLAACSHGELAAVLGLIQGAFPVVNVFFELGRPGARFAQDRLEAYRLSDIQHHTRLQSPEQVVACLNLIDDSFHRVRGSAEAALFGLEGGYCFIATETQQNIRRLWFELIDHGDAVPAPPPAAPAAGSAGAANDLPAGPAAAPGTQ